MNTVTKSIREIGVLTIALTLALVANFAYGQWTDAPANPPNSNVAAPINVSAFAQTKTGWLTAPVFRAADRMQSDLYCDYAGGNCFAPVDVGSSGIPNCSDGEILEYSGGSWSCATAPSSGISSVTTQSCSQPHASGGGTASCSVSCPAGTVRTGCSGTAPQDMSSITPSGLNACSCTGYGGGSSGSVTCIAYCAQ